MGQARSFTREPQALRVMGSVRICTRSPLGTRSCHPGVSGLFVLYPQHRKSDAFGLPAHQRGHTADWEVGLRIKRI